MLHFSPDNECGDSPRQARARFNEMSSRSQVTAAHEALARSGMPANERLALSDRSVIVAGRSVIVNEAHEQQNREKNND